MGRHMIEIDILNPHNPGEMLSLSIWQHRVVASTGFWEMWFSRTRKKPPGGRQHVGRQMENLLWGIIFAFFSAEHSQAMSQSVTSDMLLNYQDIVRLTGEKSIILIDVRQPHELQETGVLPTSINIPLNNLKTALESLSSEEFQKEYDIPLPDKTAPLVFTCRSGNRSMKALLIALELGFKNAKHYTGGYLDWEKNKGLPQ